MNNIALSRIKKLVVISMLITFPLLASGQYPMVSMSYERSNFNDGLPLPAETYYILTGYASPETEMVEHLVFSTSRIEDKSPLYKTTWLRDNSSSRPEFYLPINYKLRRGEEYTVLISYFRTAEQEEIQTLENELVTTLNTYVDLSFIKGKKSFSLVKGSGSMIQDMDEIVNKALLTYRSPVNHSFTGFSDIVRKQMDVLDKLNYNKGNGKKNEPKDSLNVADKHLNQLKDRMQSELEQIFKYGLKIQYDRKLIENYPVEELQNTITLNLGYGVVPLSLDANDQNVGGGIMAGVTIPFGNAAFAPKVISRTAFMAGIFVSNFSDGTDAEITGPVISKPIYAGLGYSAFRFLRITAGAVVLSQTTGGHEAIYIRPYLGLTVDINLWMGLGKQ